MAASLRGLGDHYVEGARPVNALDPVELDVRGGRRPGDEGERPALPDGLLEPLDGFRNKAHDTLGEDDAEGGVRNERKGPPPLPRAAIEHDGAGLGDGKCTTGERAGERVEVVAGERATDGADRRCP